MADSLISYQTTTLVAPATDSPIGYAVGIQTTGVTDTRTGEPA